MLHHATRVLPVLESNDEGRPAQNFSLFKMRRGPALIDACLYHTGAMPAFHEFLCHHCKYNINAKRAVDKAMILLYLRGLLSMSYDEFILSWRARVRFSICLKYLMITALTAAFIGGEMKAAKHDEERQRRQRDIKAPAFTAHTLVTRRRSTAFLRKLPFYTSVEATAFLSILARQPRLSFDVRPRRSHAICLNQHNVYLFRE